MINIKKIFSTTLAALMIVSSSAAVSSIASNRITIPMTVFAAGTDGEKTTTVYEHPSDHITVVFRVVYHKKYDVNVYGNTDSIYDALECLGYDGSYRNRKNNIAPVNSGFGGYSGKPEENRRMLNLLKEGKLIRTKTYVTAYYS